MLAQERAWLRALRRGCERAGIPHASTNDLRRTFCSWCRQRGVPLEDCIDWLGHASEQMAREVYSHQSREVGLQHIQKLPTARSRKSPAALTGREPSRATRHKLLQHKR
jgi:integrase